MDNFNSLVYYATTADFELMFEQLQYYDEDDLRIDTVAYGWHDGGLERALRNTSEGNGQPLYFRGNALFSSIDDAKNYYLSDPEVEEQADSGGLYDSDEGLMRDTHVPFGMIVPVWNKLPGDGRGGFYGYELVSVTIILFWQELV